MATVKQKRVAKKIVENLTVPKPLTAKEIVVSSGYAPVMGKNSHVVMESAGVREELAVLGFSLEEADKTVAHLLKSAEREETQLNAADKIYKRLGGYAPEKNINLNVEVEASEEVKAAANLLNEYFRTSGSSNGIETIALGTETQDKE